MTINNDFDVLSLDNCRLRTHIVIPKTIVKDIPLLNSCIVLQKVFFGKVLADGTIEQGTVFWGAIDPR